MESHRGVAGTHSFPSLNYRIYDYSTVQLSNFSTPNDSTVFKRSRVLPRITWNAAFVSPVKISDKNFYDKSADKSFSYSASAFFTRDRLNRWRRRPHFAKLFEVDVTDSFANVH
jgi:hypothetical protein